MVLKGHSLRDSPRKSSRTASSMELSLPRRHLLCVPLVQWLKRHGLCRCCDRQGEHYGEQPDYPFLLANAAFVYGAHALIHFSISSHRFSCAVRPPRRSRISFSLTCYDAHAESR